MTETTQRGDAYDQYWDECSRPNKPYQSRQGIESPEEAYRIWEGPDHIIDEGATAFDHRLRSLLCGIVIGCAIGLLSMAIFVTH